MRLTSIISLIIGTVFGAFFVFFAHANQSDPLMWYSTRLFGIIAYLLLAVLILLGELRLLGFKTSTKYHCAFGVLTFYAVFLHFVSAVFDKYMWAKNYGLIDYIGLNYSNKWLTLVSIGSLMFYMIILISISSTNKNIQRLTYKRWKLTHMLSYITIFGVFIHSILLGTDVKKSELSFWIYPLMIFAFSFITALLVLRIFRHLFLDKTNLYLGITLVLILALGITVITDMNRIKKDRIERLEQLRTNTLNELTYIDAVNQNIYNQAAYIQARIDYSKNISQTLSSMIIRLNSELDR